LTIVGASARAAAQSAVRAGFAVRAGDLFADVDLQECCQAVRVSDYPAGLERVVRGPQPGPWMYTGALENHPRMVRRLARERPLLGNPADVLVAVRDPGKWSRALRACGVACPRVVTAREEVPSDGTWLCKPLLSAGGAGISFAGETVDRDASRRRGAFLQEYVAGTACSAVYLGAGEKCALLGTTRQLIGAAWTGASGFRYCGSIGPLRWPASVTVCFIRIGEVLAAEFKLRGLFGVDVVVNEQGVWPVEVNPRFTASVEILEWATGIAPVGLHVAACETSRLPNVHAVDRGLVCGKAIVFATEAAVVATDLRQSLGEPATQRWPTLADIPTPGTVVKPGWPIVTVLAGGADEMQVLDQLRGKAAQARLALRTLAPS
jgi:predicted ATP-grasp superfamily ATP-dependent carboligase